MPTILIVDDMRIVSEPIAVALASRGFRTFCAADGREALSIIDDHPVDLVLLDLAMPEVDGLEFLRQIRQRAAPVPRVIVFTASTNVDLLKEAFALGACDCLLKSAFSLDFLEARIRKHLGEAVAANAAAPAAAPATAAPPGAGNPPPPPAAPPRDTAVQAAPGAVVLAHDATAIDALKSLRPILTRAQINDQLDKLGEVKALSPAVTQVLKLTGSSTASIDQVARAIRQDQAIALKILKLANSSVYSRGEPIDSLQKAVARIGLTQLRQTVMNISVIDRFADNTRPTRLNAPLFWEHAIATGLITAEISRAVGGTDADADTGFTMGLLHDVGRMVFSEQFGPVYEQVLEAADRLRLPLDQVETRMLLVNHADLMDKVLRTWKFSNALINPISLHHLSMGNIRNLAPRMVQEVATLALANRLAHAMILGSSGNMALYDTIEFAQALRLGPDVIGRIVDTIPTQSDDLKFTMVSATNHAAWPDLKDTLRQRIGGEFRPIFIGCDAPIDAYAIFVELLRTPAAEQPPNIAIVHLRNGKERIEVTTALKHAEEKAGVKALPVIAISPKGNIVLENSSMAGRQHRLLSSPTSILRFVDCIAELTPRAAAAAA